MERTVYQEKYLLLSLSFLSCFLVVAFFRGSFSAIDLSVNMWAASVNTNFFSLPAKLISIAFDTTVLLGVSLTIATILFLIHRKRYGLLLLGAMGGDALLVDVCKIVTASPRPLNEIVTEMNNSFPSGHVTGTIVLFGLLAYIAWKHWRTTKIRVSATMIYASVTAVVGFDRIYLNVHWLSDVIGAVLLGSFWLAFSIYIFNRLSRTDKLKRFLTAPNQRHTSAPIRKPTLFSAKHSHDVQG